MTIPSQLHFVGIGGVGMSALATVWKDKGGIVSGSDVQPSAIVSRLQASGIPVAIGHARANVPGIDGGSRPADIGLVVSTAVAPDNPEVLAARQAGIPILHRSEILAALMASGRSVAVTGTHGKTTTSAMIGTLLLEGGLDPTILVGGEVPWIGGNARTGHSDLLVAEADESDRSVLRLSAKWAVVTNLECDHLDHYRDLEDIVDTIATWIDRLPNDAQVVACVDDPGVRRLLERIGRRAITYGWSPEADFCISSEQLAGSGSDFVVNGERYELSVPGRHNVADATAAIAVAQLCGLSPEAIRLGLARFSGVGRRFQARGTAAGIQVFEDYGHHPSEIRATLEAARLLKRPVWILFQPHRYSRTAALMEDFAACFEGAAGLGLMDIYSAGEAPNGVTSAALEARVKARCPRLEVHYWPDHDQATGGLLQVIRPGDVVLLMGAGNVGKVAEPLLAQLQLLEEAVSVSPA